MFMTPLEIFSLMDGLHCTELTIFLMLLAQVKTIGLILVIVPLMIVVAIAVIIPLVVVVSASLHGHRNDQGGAQHQPTCHFTTEHPKSTHFILLSLLEPELSTRIFMRAELRRLAVQESNSRSKL